MTWGLFPRAQTLRSVSFHLQTQSCLHWSTLIGTVSGCRITLILDTLSKCLLSHSSTLTNDSSRGQSYFGSIIPAFFLYKQAQRGPNILWRKQATLSSHTAAQLALLCQGSGWLSDSRGAPWKWSRHRPLSWQVWVVGSWNMPRSFSLIYSSQIQPQSWSPARSWRPLDFLTDSVLKMALKGTQTCRSAGAGNVSYNVFYQENIVYVWKKKNIWRPLRVSLSWRSHIQLITTRRTNFMVIL